MLLGTDLVNISWNSHFCVTICNFLYHRIWPTMLWLPQKPWSSPPTVLIRQFLRLQSARGVISRIHSSWNVSPVIGGGHLTYLNHTIANVHLKAFAFVLDILQSRLRISPKGSPTDLVCPFLPLTLCTSLQTM